MTGIAMIEDKAFSLTEKLLGYNLFHKTFNYDDKDFLYFQTLTLKAAYSSGVENPGLTEFLHQTVQEVKSVLSNNSDTVTLELCLRILGQEYCKGFGIADLAVSAKTRPFEMTQYWKCFHGEIDNRTIRKILSSFEITPPAPPVPLKNYMLKLISFIFSREDIFLLQVLSHYPDAIYARLKYMKKDPISMKKA